MNQERILYEDQDIIVCRKAAGIATQTSRVGQADMVSEVANYLADPVSSKSPYVGLVHRLDQPVEGILVFAKNRQAASGVSSQVAQNRMEKYYYAMVCGEAFPKKGTLTDYLLKDTKTNTSRIVPPEVKGAKKAVLDYEILGEAVWQKEPSLQKIALARIRLHTGRHHQIRVQMSSAGMSLLGDYKYAKACFVEVSEQMHLKEIALCAYRLVFYHPRNGKKMQFQIKPEGKGFQMAEFGKYYELDG